MYPSLAEDVDLIVERIKNVERGKYTILLTGPAGVGKTVWAC